MSENKPVYKVGAASCCSSPCSIVVQYLRKVLDGVSAGQREVSDISVPDLRDAAKFAGGVAMNEEHREDVNPPMRPVEKFIVCAIVVIVVVLVLSLLGIRF